MQCKYNSFYQWSTIQKENLLLSVFGVYQMLFLISMDDHQIS